MIQELIINNTKLFFINLLSLIKISIMIIILDHYENAILYQNFRMNVNLNHTF